MVPLATRQPLSAVALTFLMLASAMLAGCTELPTEVSGSDDDSGSIDDLGNGTLNGTDPLQNSSGGGEPDPDLGDGNQTGDNRTEDDGNESTMIPPCPEGATGHPECVCSPSLNGTVVLDEVTGTWVGQCAPPAEPPASVMWGNSSVRFLYLNIEMESADQATPFHLLFSANPMATQNPVNMTRICSTEMGHGHDVWEGWVTGPFNSITSWSVRNANGLSLGMFVSNGNLTSSTIDAMVHPTAISTEMDGSNGHLEAIISDRLRFVCPVPPSNSTDTDGDGMPDAWEAFHGLMPEVANDAGRDGDEDGLNNLQEYLNGTDPNDADTDQDGLPDGYEAVNACCDPTNGTDASEDADMDTLPNLAEFQNGTHPGNNDTDGDGMTDGWEVRGGLDGADPNDLNNDTDSDGWINICEFEFGTDPSDATSRPDQDQAQQGCSWNVDSDGDGWLDWIEVLWCLTDANDVTSAPLDTDADGVCDTADAFPYDATESSDSDGDGVGDNADTFPDDPQESADSDADGVGDNADVWPLDARWRNDTDQDGLADAWEMNTFGSLLGNSSADHDGDGLVSLLEFLLGTDALSADTDSDGCTDNMDWAPLNSSECFDTDGDGIGDEADATPWIPTNGTGTFTMEYTIIGLERGHELTWLQPLVQAWAYVHQASPNFVWTDGPRSPVVAMQDMPNLNSTLRALGLTVANLSTTQNQSLGADVEGVDWDYNSTTEIEWRVYSGDMCLFYVDDRPLFGINTTLLMYLDFSDAISSWGQLPVTMWGASNFASIIDLTDASTPIGHRKILDAIRQDAANGSLSYNFTSQDAIIVNTYHWQSGALPANATSWLSDEVNASGGNLRGGLYESINATVRADSTATTVSPPAPSSAPPPGSTSAGGEGAISQSARRD